MRIFIPFCFLFLLFFSCGKKKSYQNESTAKNDYYKNVSNVMDLSNRGLVSIPDNIPDNIVSLDLSKNRIKQIDVSKLPSKLRILNLSNNQLDTIPAFEGAALTVLNLSYNSLRDVPSLKARSLEVLDLSHNKIKKQGTWLKYSFSNLEELRELDLSFNEVTYDFDTHSSDFKKLESLFLNNNKLTKVSIGNQLKIIDVSQNDLRTFHCDTERLEYLNISKNKRLPSELTISKFESYQKIIRNEIRDDRPLTFDNPIESAISIYYEDKPDTEQLPLDQCVVLEFDGESDYMNHIKLKLIMIDPSNISGRFIRKPPSMQLDNYFSDHVKGRFVNNTFILELYDYDAYKQEYVKIKDREVLELTYNPKGYALGKRSSEMSSSFTYQLDLFSMGKYIDYHKDSYHKVYDMPLENGKSTSKTIAIDWWYFTLNLNDEIINNRINKLVISDLFDGLGHYEDIKAFKQMYDDAIDNKDLTKLNFEFPELLNMTVFVREVGDDFLTVEYIKKGSTVKYIKKGSTVKYKPAESRFVSYNLKSGGYLLFKENFASKYKETILKLLEKKLRTEYGVTKSLLSDYVLDEKITLFEDRVIFRFIPKHAKIDKTREIDLSLYQLDQYFSNDAVLKIVRNSYSE